MSQNITKGVQTQINNLATWHQTESLQNGKQFKSIFSNILNEKVLDSKSTMSTSSNECECDYFQYGGGWANEMESPWYSTFGQPMIYYSRVLPFHRWQGNRQTEKEKPNCFKKAFRWYTQERKPLINGRTASSNMNNAKLKGFAAWLDEKYNEYLQAGRIERSKYILTQTSTVEIDKTTNCSSKKRRKYSNSREKGDVIMKSNKSVEILLKPKDWSRPASECCQRTKAQSCCNRSNSNVVESNASTRSRVTKPKSQSLTSFVKEREIYIMPFDIPDYYANRSQEHEYGKISSLDVPKKGSRCNTKRHRPRHVSCQCSKYMAGTVDTYSQFGNEEVKTPDPCNCNFNNVEVKSYIHNRNIDEKKECVTPECKASVTQPKTAPEYVLHKKETSFTATSMLSERNEAALVAPVNDSVQTSDHSINLNKNSEYPLFVKIVRADKLEEQ